MVSRNNGIVYSRAKGFSDLAVKTPLKLNDQFVIGSISKQITAVLILREFERGKLDLNDKIEKYLPEIKQFWAKEVSIHHLLTHTHGIKDVEKPLEFNQGSKFKYSQLGYHLLARILERTNNQSFQKIVTDFFDKHDLNNTYHPDNNGYKNFVKGYIEKENGELTFAPNSLKNYTAAGSFISNVQDLNKWNKLLYSGKLVKNKTLALMKRKYATRIHPIFDGVAYGYGLLFKDGEENIEIGALGYAQGFVSACYYYPQTNMNVIVLGNIARNLNDFKKTFKVHTEIMEIVKCEGLI